MIPETNILGVITNLWVEKFPEGDTTAYPKGLVKRISCVPTKDKSRVNGQYTSRIRIQWYADNTILFDTKMATYLTSVRGLESNASIKNVNYDSRTDGYDVDTDKHIMALDFIIKHNLT